MESIVRDYINREGSARLGLMPVEDDIALIGSEILDSLSIQKLVLFIEDRFGVKVPPGDVVLENFETVGAVCR
jgi:acyl carrier protein